MLGSRTPAGWRWKPSGFRSSSPIMLFTWIPVPGTTTPEPSPFVLVTLQAMPVGVEHRDVRRGDRAARRGSARRTRRAPSPSNELCGALAPARPAIAPTICASVGWPGSRVEQRQRVGKQQAARRRRRVRVEVASAVGDADRTPLDRAVVGHVLARQRAAARVDPVGDRRRHLAAVEGLGAVARRAARSSRRARGSGSARPRAAPAHRGAQIAAHSGVSASSPSRIFATYACCALSCTPSRARRSPLGAAIVASGSVAQRSAAATHARRHARDGARGGAAVEGLHCVAERHFDGVELARRARRAAGSACCTKKSSSTGSLPGSATSM